MICKFKMTDMLHTENKIFRHMFVLLWLPTILLATDMQGPNASNTGNAGGIWSSGNAAGTIVDSGTSGITVTGGNTSSSSHHITVQLGATAFLHCRARAVDRALSGAEQVSWVRRRDWHILSSGMFVYTNDERFQVLHPEGSDDWTLQIKYVQKRDNGTYECQVSTGTGVVSHLVHVHIVVPEAHIVGGSGEHHVDVGSVISLVCVIERSPTPPQYVFWYHNDRMINYDTERHVHVRTEPTVAHTRSKLTVRTARETDSGNYTCSAANAEPASIHVFVSEADKMAAILRRKTSVGNIITSEMTFFIIGFSIIFLTMR